MTTDQKTKAQMIAKLKQKQLEQQKRIEKLHNTISNQMENIKSKKN